MIYRVRHAIRVVFRQPAFAATAIATLATGIGLNVAVFGLFNAMLFRPLPVHQPEQLVAILSDSTSPDGPRGNLTYPIFQSLAERRDVLASAFAYSQAILGVSASNVALRVEGQIVSPNMFDVLGVRVVSGRTFHESDFSEPVAVVSFDVWRRVFGGSDDAIGNTLTVNGHTLTIVGIAPPGFSGPDRFQPSSVWMPLGLYAVAFPGAQDMLSPDSWWLTGIGRLAPDARLASARAVLAGVGRGLAQSRPTLEGVTIRVERYRGTEAQSWNDTLPIGAAVMGITLCVLLISCANVAALLLSRAAFRQREIGIRLAIGATRADLTRQLLMESFVLAFTAAGVGLIVAMWGTEALVRFAGLPEGLDGAPDWRVGAFTLIVTLLAGLAFGLAPALRAAGLPVVPSLRADPGATNARPGRTRLQRALVAGQLAVSLVLLASAGVLIRGLAAAWTIDIGFTYENRVAVSTDVRLQHYDTARARVFYEAALAGVRGLPGVEGATLAHVVPFGGQVHVYRAFLPGSGPDATGERASVNRVWTGFFSTLSIPIVEGRDFSAADLTPTADAAIVSATMARRLWPGGQAIGQRFFLGDPAGPAHVVVGVARDVRVDEFSERPWSAVWLPHSGEAGEVVILATSPRPTAPVLREIEGIIRGLDRDLPIHHARPLAAYVAERLDGERALSKLLAVCGLLAIGLASIGLYSLTAYGVTLRRREIGLRMALGADGRDVQRMFIGEGVRLATHGVLWGLLPALAATYVLSGAIVGLFPIDPVTLAGATLVLALTTTAATYVPARRAARLDPIDVLRTE